MVLKKYLTGLDANDYDIPGIFGVAHARKPGSWRIICSYADGKRHKQRLFKNMAAAGQAEARKTWEFHHIVEGQHYADVDFSGRLVQLYADQLPCVLIAKEEHLAYNRLLHISQTDELYRDRGLPADLRRRSAAAAAAARQPANHARLRTQVQQLSKLYQNAYTGDPVLATVAKNILADVLSFL